MKIMITGATGFIGSRLLTRLADEENQISILCRPSSNISLLPVKNTKILLGDITDPISVDSCIRDCEQVYHLAAYAKNWARDKSTFFKYNDLALRNILDSSLKHNVKRVLFMSSSVTLGPANSHLVDENTIRSVGPFTDYESSKLEAEKTALEYCNKGPDIVIVNPTRLFGPGLMTEGNSVTKMIELYLKGKFRFILGSGEAVGNYAFIDDVVEGCINAMQKGKSGEKYILGGENLSYNELFGKVEKLSLKKFSMIHVPQKLCLLYSGFEKLLAGISNHYPQITPEWVKTFSMDWAFSCNKAINEIDYKITSFNLALEKTLNWIYSNNGMMR